MSHRSTDPGPGTEPPDDVGELATAHAELLSVTGTELSESGDVIDTLSRSAAETSESVDEVADTTYAFADDVDELAHGVIDAIPQANELGERLDD